MSVRIIKQKQGQQIKSSVNGETISTSPVLIESTLLIMPDRPVTPIVPLEQIEQPTNVSTTMNDCGPVRAISTLDHSSTVPSTSIPYPRSAIHRTHVPIHNASQWFSGPDMKNDRIERIEHLASSLVRRSFRPSLTYAYDFIRTYYRNFKMKIARDLQFSPFERGAQGTQIYVKIEKFRNVSMPTLLSLFKRAGSGQHSYKFLTSRLCFA